MQRQHCMSTLIYQVTCVTLTDKTDHKNHTKREDYWIHTQKKQSTTWA